MAKILMKYIKLYPHFLSMGIKAKLSYRADAIVGIIGFFITNIAAFFTLYLTISSIPSLNGWTIERMAFLYGFCLIPKSIDHMFSDNIWAISGWMIRRGDLDRFLTRPVNPLYSIIASDFQQEGIGEFVLGIVFICIYGPKQDIVWNANNLIPLLICTFFAIFLFMGIKLIFASIAFYTKRSIELMTTIYELSNYTKYPVEIFNNTVKVVLTYIIPFSLVMYYPIAYLYNDKSIWMLTIIIIFVCLTVLSLGLLMWKIGLKHYESSGS